MAAIAFDIDGVFKYGRQWSMEGLGALGSVEAAGIPYLFVTNGGGGLSEGEYAESLDGKIRSAAGADAELDMSVPRVDASKLVLSYSPWREYLAPKLAKDRVLLVGDPKEKTLAVAAEYGFENVTHYRDYAESHPTVNPFSPAAPSHTAVANPTTPRESEVREGSLKKRPRLYSSASASEATPTGGAPEEPFAAVLVLCDPYDWFCASRIGVRRTFLRSASHKVPKRFRRVFRATVDGVPRS